LSPAEFEETTLVEGDAALRRCVYRNGASPYHHCHIVLAWIMQEPLPTEWGSVSKG
jgi:hypothetical protein